MEEAFIIIIKIESIGGIQSIWELLHKKKFIHSETKLRIWA